MANWVSNCFSTHNSYQEMFGALRQASALAEKPEEGRLIRILTGTTASDFSDRLSYPSGSPETITSRSAPATGPVLNVSQQAAVR